MPRNEVLISSLVSSLSNHNYEKLRNKNRKALCTLQFLKLKWTWIWTRTPLHLCKCRLVTDPHNYGHDVKHRDFCFCKNKNRLFDCSQLPVTGDLLQNNLNSYLAVMMCIVKPATGNATAVLNRINPPSASNCWTFSTLLEGQWNSWHSSLNASLLAHSLAVMTPGSPGISLFFSISLKEGGWGTHTAFQHCEETIRQACLLRLQCSGWLLSYSMTCKQAPFLHFSITFSSVKLASLNRRSLSNKLAFYRSAGDYKSPMGY